MSMDFYQHGKPSASLVINMISVQLLSLSTW